MLAIKKEIQWGDHQLKLETGVIARQASGAVMVDLDGTTVLVTVVGLEGSDEGKDFFPLRVDYQEKSYANGKIPGGYFKREGRPSERETLICRLIDRPIRPLFPKGFRNEVQVIANVLSLNPEIEPDIPAMIGTSAALAISGIPFSGPMAAARVGYANGEYLLNPTQKQLGTSDLDLVVAGSEQSVLMVESEANILSEEVMLGAVMFGHEQFQPVIQAIKEFAEATQVTPWEWQAASTNTALEEQVKQAVRGKLEQAYTITEKQTRRNELATIRETAVAEFATDDTAEVPVTEKEVLTLVEAQESDIVRGRILSGEKRIDGRTTSDIRNINAQVGILDRTHGSALFTRGETQALVVTTLGTTRDAQILDGPFGEERDRFMLHYNFPPFSVGEVGMVGSPKRREIGHGRLAKRGLLAVVPDDTEFPYVLRVVSEITESNGSSSMASVCGGSLAMMDAGVPIKAPVAGIAMGLIKGDTEFAVLSDILSDEDHLGDMDFKVAGTKDGITALQMDIKIDGITKEIMEKALEQAKAGRHHILGEMQKAIETPREDLSMHAPRITSIKVNPEKIKDIIGKGGATIRALTEETGATIEINDEGIVQIISNDGNASAAAIKQIERITAEVEVGKTYEGKVVRIVDFGAFVNFLPGKDGLVHISQISEKRIEKVTDELEEGQMVQVKVLEIDRQGRVRLSMKAVESEEVAE